MADSRVNITLNHEISEYLTELARIKNQSIQDLAQELMQEAIEIEKEVWHWLSLLLSVRVQKGLSLKMLSGSDTLQNRTFRGCY